MLGWITGAVILAAAIAVGNYRLRAAYERDRPTLLEIVHQLGPNAYGVPIWEALDAYLGQHASIGHIHTSLQRMQAEGLFTSHLKPNDTGKRGGRPKRHYTITKKGLEELARYRREQASKTT